MQAFSMPQWPRTRAASRSASACAGQAGDTEDNLDAAPAGALIDPLPLEAKDLLQAEPAAILGGQSAGSLQSTYFNATAVQVRPPVVVIVSATTCGSVNRVAMSSHKVSWLALAVRT